MAKLLNREQMEARINKLGGALKKVDGMLPEDEKMAKGYLVGEILGLFERSDLPLAITLFNEVAGFEVTLRKDGQEGDLLLF